MIIGLCGPAGGGKSAAAKALSTHYGLPIVPFAAPLKSMLETMGVPPECLYGSIDDKSRPLEILGGRSARHAMQTLGTQWGRDCIDSDLWVRAWASRVTGGAIADDVRFQNESRMIMNAGGLVICVVRSMGDLDSTPGHASENFAVIDRHRVIVNDGSLDDLKWRLVSAVDSHCLVACD